MPAGSSHGYIGRGLLAAPAVALPPGAVLAVKCLDCQQIRFQPLPSLA
jgi:hypothetical protein